jgi:hypothetical protein
VRRLKGNSFGTSGRHFASGESGDITTVTFWKGPRACASVLMRLATVRNEVFEEFDLEC